MSLRKLTVICCLVAFGTSAGLAQALRHRDPAAVSTVNKCLVASGWNSSNRRVSDAVASGTITYYYYPSNVVGSVTAKARGDSELRIDSGVNVGVVSWAVNERGGRAKDASGTITDIPYHNAFSLAIPLLPYAGLSAGVNDPEADITELSEPSLAAASLRQIRVVRHLAASVDPLDQVARIRTADYFLEATSLRLVGIVDKTHLRRTVTRELQHAYYYGDYRLVDGMLVPFSITEEIGNQKIWTIQLSDIRFNVNLTDAYFVIQ